MKLEEMVHVPLNVLTELVRRHRVIDAASFVPQQRKRVGPRIIVLIFPFCFMSFATQTFTFELSCMLIGDKYAFV